MELSNYILTVPDFPSEGILFRDISPLIGDGAAYRYATKLLADYAREKDVDVVVGPDARGFVVGCPVATELGVGFVPVRKKGKLPGNLVEVSYSLEYGEATLQMHRDSIKPGQRVLITDDLLATGGTIAATIKMVEELGGIVVGVAFYIELADLNGREKFPGYDIKVLLTY